MSNFIYFLCKFNYSCKKLYYPKNAAIIQSKNIILLPKEKAAAGTNRSVRRAAANFEQHYILSLRSLSKVLLHKNNDNLHLSS